MSRSKKQRAYSFGLKAEWLAAFYLRCKFYQIIAMRYRNSAGEIDIIAKKGRMLVVVEVKARRLLSQCVEAITPQKQQKIARTLEGLLSGQGEIAGLVTSHTDNIRFDVIWVAAGCLPRHIKDAWRM